MGITRNVSGQVDFSGLAAYLLRREYAKYRLMARMNLRIQEDTRQPMNTYTEIYNGKLDFTKKVDKQNTFTVGAISNDFSTNIDAYDTQDFIIPLTDAINLELPGIALDEIATLIPSVPPDGILHSDYFPPIQIVNNTQNSVAASVQSVPYRQFRDPDFSTESTWFFHCQYSGNILVNINITTHIHVDPGAGLRQLQLAIYDQNGALIEMLVDATIVGDLDLPVNLSKVFAVTKGDKWFLYMKQVSAETSNTGINITGGQIDLSYKTITPATMCQAISGTQLFGRLLQAMNINQDSGPNLPVPFQSYLLSASSALGNVYFTCSDSIRAAQGSIFAAGDTIGPGVFKVISGSVTYAGIVYTINQQFTFVNASDTFTGTGIVQKIQSAFVGNVYNIGDDLQPGGTYLVGGITSGGTVTYNAHIYGIGEIFKYVLGADTFTGSDDTMFVKQIAIDPQIVINFAKFFQAIKSIQGGDAAFGVENGVCFLENLANVFRSGVGTANLGIVPKDWQSECAVDMLYNTLKVGQKTQQYDAINGNQEVSAEQSWTSPQLTPATELNLVSEIRFDPFGIEIVRITQNDTAASRSDNDTWGIYINQNTIFAGDYQYKRPLGAEGLIVPILGVPVQYYNYNLSPKHNLLRGSRYLASIFYNMPGYQLTLTGYDKNVAMVCVGLDGVRVAESEPVDLGGLGKPYFIPEYYTNTVTGGLIDANSYADIGFTVNGNKMRGFVVNYKSALATKKPQPVKLLLGPNENLLLTVRPIIVTGVPVAPILPPEP